MQDFSKFIVENWQPLLSALLSLIAVVIVLIKKRPSADSVIHIIQDIITTDLPGFIIAAEKSGEIGSKKFALVLKSCMVTLESRVHLDQKATSQAETMFSEAIEMILSTPRKKV